MKRRVTTRRQVEQGVAFHRLASGKKRLLDKRTITVLGSLVVGMTLVSTLLLLLEPGPGHRDNVWSLSAIDMSSDIARDEILNVPSDRSWEYIIIHDSRGVTGDGDDLNRAWDEYYAGRDMETPRGAGYHFVINDAQGRSDGEVEICRRWKAQEAGDYIIDDEQADYWNRVSIGICLMGDAEEQAFSDDQMESVVQLVRMLQEAYNIPRSHVFVQTGRDAESSPARFELGTFNAQIRD